MKEVLGIAGVFNMCGNMAKHRYATGHRRDSCQYSVVRLCRVVVDGTYWSHFISVYRRPAGSSR